MSQSCSNNLELTGSTYSLLRNAFPFLHSSLQPLLGTTTTATTGVLMIPGLNLSQLTNQRQVDACKTARSAYLLVSWERSTTAISYSVMPMSRCTHSKALRRRLVMGTG